MKINLTKFDYQSNKILDVLSDEDKSLFLSMTEHLHFKKGQLVFYESGVPMGIFLIKKGMGKIFKTGIYGRNQIFYLYKPGDLLGYHALLCDETYEESCETIENCEILFINKDNFNFLLLKIENLKMLFIKNMSHEFGVLVNTIVVLAQKSLRERLALYLLILEERFKKSQDMEGLIDLTREDLANVIGTTRESLGRLMKEFREDELIQFLSKKIKIRNRTKLNQIAGFMQDNNTD